MEYEHENWLGTERVRTDYTGATTISIFDLPWGDGHTPSGDNGEQHDFALMDRDLEDSNEHAQFRNYSMILGRWLSPDPYLGSYDFSNPQSFDRYAYALNNPVTFLDPSGLDEQCQATEGGYVCTSDGNDDGSQGGDGSGGYSSDPNPPGSQGQPYTIQGPTAYACVILCNDQYVYSYTPDGPDPSLGGSGWQLFGAIPAGSVYGPTSVSTGGTAPNNGKPPCTGCTPAKNYPTVVCSEGGCNMADPWIPCSTVKKVGTATQVAGGGAVVFSPFAGPAAPEVSAVGKGVAFLGTLLNAASVFGFGCVP